MELPVEKKIVFTVQQVKTIFVSRWLDVHCSVQCHNNIIKTFFFFCVVNSCYQQMALVSTVSRHRRNGEVKKYVYLYTCMALNKEEVPRDE